MLCSHSFVAVCCASREYVEKILQSGVDSAIFKVKWCRCFCFFDFPLTLLDILFVSSKWQDIPGGRTHNLCLSTAEKLKSVIGLFTEVLRSVSLIGLVLEYAGMKQLRGTMKS